MSDPVISDLQLRAYFASVIGAVRAPFGVRRFVNALVGDTVQLAQNSTKDRVLRVTVSRSDIGGGATAAVFTQNNSAASNDFLVSFLSTSSFQFVLYPSEMLSIQTATVALPIVVGQETY